MFPGHTHPERPREGVQLSCLGQAGPKLRLSEPAATWELEGAMKGWDLLKSIVILSPNPFVLGRRVQASEPLSSFQGHELSKVSPVIRETTPSLLKREIR